MIVKGLLCKKDKGDALFRHLDTLFDIPTPEEKPQKSEEELINEFNEYIKESDVV